MEFDELLRQMRFEYHSYLAALRSNDEQHGTQTAREAPTFYGYLLRRGYSRQELSAHGIGRDVEA